MHCPGTSTVYVQWSRLCCIRNLCCRHCWSSHPRRPPPFLLCVNNGGTGGQRQTGSWSSWTNASNQPSLKCLLCENIFKGLNSYWTFSFWKTKAFLTDSSSHSYPGNHNLRTISTDWSSIRGKALERWRNLKLCPIFPKMLERDFRMIESMFSNIWWALMGKTD